MLRPWRWPIFLRAYEHLPQAAIDSAVASLMRRERPRWLVKVLIAAWVRRGRIDLSEVEVADWASVEAFFLRRLRPGARPLGEGLVAPVDGRMVASGAASRGLMVKGHALDVATLLGAALGFEANVATLFLTPDGYHHVHAPVALQIVRVTRIAGRSFPQNDDALALRPDVYLANARVVVHAESARGPVVMVLVGASLISGIHVAAPGRYAKGEAIGAFSFGSTVVTLWPAAWGECERRPGERIALGETLVAGD